TLVTCPFCKERISKPSKFARIPQNEGLKVPPWQPTGTPENSARVPLRSLSWAIAMGVAGILLSLLFIVGLPYLAPNPPVQILFQLIRFGFGGFCLGAGLYYVVWAPVVTRKWVVHIYSDGFSYEAGRETGACAWDEIQAIYAQMATS